MEAECSDPERVFFRSQFVLLFDRAPGSNVESRMPRRSWLHARTALSCEGAPQPHTKRGRCTRPYRPIDCPLIKPERPVGSTRIGWRLPLLKSLPRMLSAGNKTSLLSGLRGCLPAMGASPRLHCREPLVGLVARGVALCEPQLLQPGKARTDVKSYSRQSGPSVLA